jgi:tRNA pseudouridine38-40 synthase
MSRYKISIEFEGTNYHGWQTQPHGGTVQDELEEAFGQILQREVDIYGQGRTDQGVHAEGQIAHLDIPETFDLQRLQYGVNGVLPDDIAVWRMEEVGDDFHARFGAVSRQYRYQVVRRARPLHRHTTHKILKTLDLDALRECARWIEGEHDFESFTKTSDEQPSAVCEVEHSEWKEAEGGFLIYRIRANRFVRYLVRRLVGTMLQVGKGRMGRDEFKGKLEVPDPDTGGFSAPSKGLILEKVKYK